MRAKVAPYGSWKSPITPALVAGGTGAPTELALDGTALYWLELRPKEGGRYALCALKGGRAVDVLGKEFNVRTRVHEYGGGSYAASDGTVWFTNFGDQRLYAKKGNAPPRPITKEGVRYADFVPDPRRSRLVTVSEDHTRNREAVNTISEVARDDTTRVLVAGNDFYSSPRLSPDQGRLAWLTWNHLEMPWDGTELWVADILEDGTLGRGRMVAGGREESVFQPEWSPGGTLYFVSDRGGWWNICRWTRGRVEKTVSMEAEFGRPHWGFGQSTYAFESDRRVLCSYLRDGGWSLALLDTVSLRLRKMKAPYTDISYVRAGPGQGFFVGASPLEEAAVVRVDLGTGSARAVYRSKGAKVGAAFISVPKHVSFPTTGGKVSHAFFYPPKNGNYAPPRGERPPLVVVSHGGPTSFSPASLRMAVQYWTSRGFAVLDVNYRGSTGYGRRYMKELEGEWGVVDVDDCAEGALYLARQGKVDVKRLVVRGGSAGGYTTLCELTFRKVFAAGASYYGVSDLEGLEKETHKFESHYCDRLVAPYPEGRAIYLRRSPVYHTDRLATPVIFFQGLEDVIVPPNQAERMVEALKAKGVPVAYIPFEGEQHGFRKEASTARALGAELSFYSRVLGFPLGEKESPVKIWNLAEKSQG
jgi:dipeptidyl aminopeptidase/acylaminoacyl peptidase